MGDFEAKLEQVLNDPKAMGQIMALAQSLGGGSQPPPPPPAPPEGTTPPGEPPEGGSMPELDPKLLGGMASLMGQLGQGDDRRTALLNALRPFLKPERYARLDQAVQIARMSRMVRAALTLLRPEGARLIQSMRDKLN